MFSSGFPAASRTLTVMCVRMCMFYSTMSLAGWPASSEAARLRCGTDLLSDLLFVCGDRGIYFGMDLHHASEIWGRLDDVRWSYNNFLFHGEWPKFTATPRQGKGTWSGYGARPRGKGIVDQCCRPPGCDLQHLEMYCAKPKNQQTTTAEPTTTATTTTTTTATTTTTTTTTAPCTTTELDTTQQFQSLFQRRLSEHLGASNSPKREAYRKKTQPSPRRKSKAPSSRRRSKTRSPTSRPPSTSGSPRQSS